MRLSFSGFRRRVLTVWTSVPMANGSSLPATTSHCIYIAVPRERMYLSFSLSVFFAVLWLCVSPLRSLLRLKKTIYSKKYGVSLVRFTHHPNAVLVASQNSFDGNWIVGVRGGEGKGRWWYHSIVLILPKLTFTESIRYLSLHDNKYLRYFKGHRNK